MIERDSSTGSEWQNPSCHSEVVRTDEESNILRITNRMWFWDKPRMTENNYYHIDT